MPANVRVGGARVDFSADASGYLATLRQVQTANRGLVGSYGGVGRSAQRQSQFIGQFTNSLRSSLIATAAYAAGVNAVRRAVGGSVSSFIEFDAGLIKIAKTTDIAEDRLEALGENLVALITEASRAGAPLNVTREQILGIAEAVGQLGIRGVRNITAFAEAAAALDVSSDLFGEEAARSLGRFIAATGTVPSRVNEIASAYTALGNAVAGGEREISQFATRIAREVVGTGGLPNETILGLAASFVNVGAAAESASTVVGRALDAINQIAGDENQRRFQLIGEAAGALPDEIERIGTALRDGTGGVEAYRDALNLLVGALASLPAVAEGGELSRGSLLELIFGNTNVRIRTNLNILARGLENYGKFQTIAGNATRDANEHYREAGRAAEGYGARLQVVGSQIQEQGRNVGGFLTPALVVLAENFRAIEFGAIGVGTALGVGFGVRRIRAIRATAVAVRQTVVANVEASRQQLVGAAISEREAAARLRAATSVAAQTRAYQALGVASARTVTARRALAIAEAGLALQTSRTARVALAARGALTFLGGPIGLLTTALTVGASAFLLFGNRADKAAERTDMLSGSLDDLLAQLRQGASGLTAEGSLLANTDAEIISLEARAEVLERRAAVLSRERIPGFFGRRVGNQAQEIRDAIESLQDRRNEIADLLQRAGDDDAAGALRSALPTFERINLSLDVATRSVRDFYQSLVDGSEAARRAAQLETELAGESPLVRIFEGLRGREAARIEAQRRTLERAFEDARENLARAQALVPRAGAEVERQAVGTEDRRRAERQLRSAKDQVFEQERLLALTRERLAAGRELSINDDRLAAQARAQRQAQIAQTVAEPVFAIPDLRGGERAARDFADTLRGDVEDRLRDLGQSQALTNVFLPEARAAVTAEFQVLNQVAERRRELAIALRNAQQEQAAAERALADALALVADAGNDATDQQLALVEATKQDVAASRAAVAEGLAAAAALDARSDAYERLAELAGDAARQIQIEADRAPTVLEGIEMAGVGAISRMGDAIVNLRREGISSFRELANSIIDDLIRVLTQIIVVENATKFFRAALGGLSDGTGGGGGIGGFLSSIFGGLFHEGGVVRGRGDKLVVLKGQEEVLTERNPRHRYNIGSQSTSDLRQWVSRLPRFHEGGVMGGDRGHRSGGGEELRVELINRGGTPQVATDGGVRFDARGAIVTVFLDDIRRNGPMSQAMALRMRRPAT